MIVFFPTRVYPNNEPSYRELADEAGEMASRAWQRKDRTVAGYLALNAWQLRQFVRWEKYTSWRLSTFLWQVGVRRFGLILFAIPATVLALRGVFGVGTDVETYLWGLALCALFGSGIGVISAALVWQHLRGLVMSARLYRERRIEVDRLLRSSTGVGGWRVVLTPEGEWQYQELETGEGAA